MTQVYKGYPIWFWSAIVLGILLRVASIWWNDRLLGDVNLFALTAREYAESGELNYPMKYDFSEKTSWGSLESAQSQHPPLWSFVAGSLADILGTKNTYGILQGMSLFSQILLLYITFKLGSFFGKECVTFILPLVALSPLLVDFAGNGSQYSMGTVFMLGASCLLMKVGSGNFLKFFCSGALCGLAYCTHGAFVLTIGAVIIASILSKGSKIGKVSNVCFATLGFVSVLIPLAFYRVEHFGSVFHNLNSVYIAGVLGKLSIVSSAAGIHWLVSDAWGYADFIAYTQNCLEVWFKFFVSILWEWGPAGILLGIFALFAKRNPQRILVLVFLATYLIPILLWPGFKSRFLAPLLPIAFLFSYFGFLSLKEGFPKFFLVGRICVWGIPIWFAFSWICSSILTGSPSRYYTFDLKHKTDYIEMLEMVDEMKALEPSLVVGSARSLDGGLEAFYYHQFPYVHARGFDWRLIERIRDDYEAKYFWTDEIMLPKYEAHLGQLKIIATSGKFRLFEFIN